VTPQRGGRVVFQILLLCVKLLAVDLPDLVDPRPHFPQVLQYLLVGAAEIVLEY
jgi:hypothetical protein